SEESVGTSSGQVLWFGRIPTIVPATTPTVTPPTTHIDTTLTPTEIPTISPIISPSLDYTPASPDYSPASDTEPDPSEDPLSDHIPPLPATSPFLSSTDITERPSYSSPAGPSRKRSRSPTTSVLLSSPTLGALSFVRADLLPPRKRVMNGFDVERSDEPHSEPDIDSEVQAEIDECITYTDALRARGIDVRVEVVTVARNVVETSTKGTVVVSNDRVTHPVVPDDIYEPAQEEGAVEVIESIQRDQGHMIIASSQQGTVMSDRISELEQDNTRLRGMLDVASQRVTRL
ncbi:hypothetical protein Tco_1333924, partial [Tanacetum coccineum]